eukprot:scaffold57368_cov36-Phaeocystis_antarctica.AAC.3
MVRGEPTFPTPATPPRGRLWVVRSARRRPAWSRGPGRYRYKSLDISAARHGFKSVALTLVKPCAYFKFYRDGRPCAAESSGRK